MADFGAKAETYGKKFKPFFPVLADAKLDGRRLLVKIENLKATALSGSGKDLSKKLYIICNYLLKKIKKYGLKNGVFDGELVSVLRPNDTYTSMWGKTGIITVKNPTVEQQRIIDEDIKFAVFDFCSLSIFDENSCFEDIIPCKKRDEILYNILDDTVHLGKGGVAYYLEKEILENEEDLEDFYQEKLREGFEGAVFKDPKMSYKNYQRTACWIKRKPVITIDCKIVDFEKGSNKNSNRLGKIIVQTEEGLVKVGGGLKDTPKGQWNLKKLQGTEKEFQTLKVESLNDRTTIWKFRHFLKGEIIEVKYQDDSHKVADCRFLRFVRFRPDIKK